MMCLRSWSTRAQQADGAWVRIVGADGAWVLIVGADILFWRGGFKSEPMGVRVKKYPRPLRAVRGC